MRSYGINRSEISHEILKISIIDMSLKNANLRLQIHLLGANELKDKHIVDAFVVQLLFSMEINKALDSY